MTQSGGPAAINGFLYQILQHLHWLADVRLSGTLDGQEVKDACLILEPQTGGDAQAHASGLYLVEQYKTRANGTWPLSGLASVLRDLRKSVPDLRPDLACYRFVTDGRRGRLEAFKSFLSRLNAIESPDDLDNDTKRKFTNTLCLSDREFLDHVAVTTRSKDAGATTAEEREIVFHLLRRFEMKFDVGRDELVSTVEARLRPYVRDLGDESGVRRRLIGNLMQRLGSGETRLDNDGLDSMFQGAGLSPDRLRKVTGLPQKLKESMHRRSSHLRYQPENDVRAVPCWPETKPVLLVAGESGSGKSWQLVRLMEESAEKGECVVFVRSGGTAEDILRRTAHEIWQVGLEETSEKTLQAISNFFREAAFQLRPPLYTIAVDDVQSVDLARDLVRQDWTSLGARLVLTVPLSVARALNSTDGEAIRLHHVDEFSIGELDALLKISGHRWADLPEDLKRLLRKPILAGLFLDLSISSFQDAPQSEYEIFQAFWDRIEEKGNRGDTGIVLALANLALQDKLYPLPREHWGRIELNNENLAALEAAGWLNCLDHGEVEFAHDRLLNWAAAQSLSWRFMHGDLSVDELFSNMTGEADGHDSDPLRRFGYVPMDTLWLLAAETNNNQVALDRVIEKMENHRAFGRDSRYLYTNLLLTLGQRAIPILLQRLNTITADSTDNYNYRIGLIGDAFAALAHRESVDVRANIDSLLQARSWDRQSVAVKALATAPAPEHLDRLWEIHQQRLYAREHPADHRVGRGHEATFSALRVGVAQQPEWLQDRIRKVDPSSEQVSELGYLLSGLDDPRAVQIWRDVRDVLMEKVPKSNPRSLLHCIMRFADHEKKDFVVEHLSYSGDIVSAAALWALAVLDPQEAINRLADIDDEQELFRNEWLPLLLRADSELTRARLRELAASNLRGLRLIEQYFEKRPADLDEEILGLVLRMRETQLRDHIGEVTTKDILWPYFQLRFLGRMCCPELLQRLQDEAGGQLEAMITKLACSRLRGNNRVQDRILEAARRTLVLFAGSGISDLVNRELDSEHFWVRHGGLNWARVSGNEGTIERLSAIARRPVPCDSAGKPKSDAFQEYCQTMIGLAALGADETLVDILSNPGVMEVPKRLADFRAHRGPMPKSLTDQAIRTMRSPETSEEALRCSLLIAWLSGDAELIPDVRAVLDRVDPKSQNALHACIALQDLGDRSAEFARMAERLADTEENIEWGLDALIGLGREGVEGLERWVEQRRNTEHVKHRESVIRALYEWAESRHHAVEAAVEQCLKSRPSSHALYEIAAESDNRTVRERILEDAFAEPSIMALLDAIRGLAKFDTNRAAEAVEFRLANYPQIKRELCQLLVQVAPESAAEKLVGAAVALERNFFSDAVGRAAVALERDPFPDAVGRALRRLDPKAVVDVVVKRLRGTETERRVVCQIAGWLPVPEIAKALEHAANRESAGAVRRAALEALYRHREEGAIRGLFSEFQTERCATRRWAFFIAILETADPHLLRDQEDALWLGQILTEDVPYAFEHYASEVLNRRSQ